jgi:putative hydroxymethylpyrimidine transport system substrate-binding protein
MLQRRVLLGGGSAVLAGAGRAGAAERVTVILDWLLNPNHAALFAAEQSGAFARAGVSVTLIAPSDPDSPCPLVAAGKADLAIGYGSQINLIDAAGLDLVRVATLIDRPLNSVMALAGRGIRTLADLRGMVVGVSVGGVEEALLGAMLHSAGVATREVTVVKVNFDMVAALLAHRLDAAIGAFRNAEVLQVRALGQTPVVFAPEDHGVPRYDELIVVARRGRRGDPVLGRFVGALREGAGALLAAPDATWRGFAAAHPELDTALTRDCWNATLPAIARDPGRLDASRYLAFQAFALAQGMIGQALALDRFAVQLPSPA